MNRGKLPVSSINQKILIIIVFFLKELFNFVTFTMYLVLIKAFAWKLTLKFCFLYLAM